MAYTATKQRPAMKQTSKPDKQRVRDYMQQRQAEQKPPPTPDEVRRQMGWDLMEAERKHKGGRDD